MRRKFIKYALVAALWVPVTLLTGIFIFSVYPSYILRGHHGLLFVRVRAVSDRIAARLFELGKDKPLYYSSGTRKIHIYEENPLPEKTNHPLMVVRFPEELPAALYFEKPTRPVVVHTTMVPDPFTTYAPAAGDINGLVFHNYQQFRYPDDLGRKKENEVRVFLTGGSTAWGAFATDTDHTIAGYLQQALRERYEGADIKVITAAAGGWTSTQERTWIFNRITEYEPDMIISYSGHNDLFQVHLRKTDLLNQYDVDGEYFLYAIEEYELFNHGRDMFDLIMTKAGENFQASDYPRKALKNIRIVSSYLKAREIPYAYVLQPVREQERSKVSPLYASLAHGAGGLSEQEEFTFIDHSRLFDARPELFYDRCHLGDRGNKLIAEDLLSRIDWDRIIRRTVSGISGRAR
ncbi:MAG: SGNH/GDSL hydrolase family protein [Nitrospirota bacterium]|nr:SGNH/GDSL hydrolase family protein [Nitrospirota bacterium]